MKIVFLTRRFFPYIGGVEEHVLEISKELTGRGHEISVISEEFSLEKKAKTYHSGTQSARKIENLNIRVFDMPSWKESFFKKFKIWLWFLKNVGILSKADIVHAHDVYFWYFPFRILFPFKKNYVTFHGYETKFPISVKAKLVRSISEKLSNANIIVGNYISKWYGTKADFIVYGGVGFIQPKTSPRLKLSPSKLNKRVKILFIGRLEEDTGIKVYIKILTILSKKNVDFVFYVFGQGRLRANASKWGKILSNEASIENAIADSDIVFASSYLSMLKALVFEKPVFSVYENPLKEDYLKLSPFSQFIVIEDNAEIMTKKILDYLKNKNFPADLKEGGRWARKQSWKKIADVYENLWKK